MTIVLRAWLRYVVPITLVAALAFVPWWLVAWRAPVPADQDGAKLSLWIGWALCGLAWIPQLCLVAPAAYLVRERPGQLAALRGGVVQLVRYAVPTLVACAAIAVGGLALVVPGLALLVLLALTGASRATGVPAALTESIAAARADRRRVAIAVGALLAIDIAIGVGAQLWLLAIPVPKKPSALQLAHYRAFVPIVAAALAAIAPLPALCLAALRDQIAPNAASAARTPAAS